VKFDNSINEIIYKEGVFPTQGARPVFTTITSLVESYVGKIIKDILELDKPITSIVWYFSKKNHIVELFDKKRKLVNKLSYPVRLKVESLRESENSELQAQVAIHESGHAVAAIYGANVLPTEIVSRSANVSEGHCAVEIPSTGLQTREELEKDIIISLGGYVAEKLIFGDDKVANGTSGDFERATSIALEMAKTYGMAGGIPMLYGHRSTATNSHWNSEKVDEMDKLAEKIIIDLEMKCKEILSDNKLLLLRLGEHLSNNSRMESSEIQEFVDNYGSPVEIKNKDNYHNFKSTIADKLAEEELGFRPKRNAASRVTTK
jgi:cell division protease FtsH